MKIDVLYIKTYIRYTMLKLYIPKYSEEAGQIILHLSTFIEY